MAFIYYNDLYIKIHIIEKLQVEKGKICGERKTMTNRKKLIGKSKINNPPKKIYSVKTSNKLQKNKKSITELSAIGRLFEGPEVTKNKSKLNFV